MLMPRDREAWMRTLQVGAWPLVPRRAVATAEDSQRAQAYQEEAERKVAVRHAASSAASLSDLLRSLQVEIEVETHVGGHEERLAQLSSRTNQFNGLPIFPIAQEQRKECGTRRQQAGSEPDGCACLSVCRAFAGDSGSALLVCEQPTRSS